MRKPIATIALIFINVLIFGYMVGMPNTLIMDYGIIPHAVESQPYRLITSMFLHTGIPHMFFNMFVLWAIGSSLEERMNIIRYLILYFIGGLGGSILVWQMAEPNSITVGASGAIFALLGAMIVYAQDNPSTFKNAITLIGLNLVFTFMIPGISWQGHIGGLVAGLVVGALFYYSGKAFSRRKSVQGNDKNPRKQVE